MFCAELSKVLEFELCNNLYEDYVIFYSPVYRDIMQSLSRLTKTSTFSLTFLYLKVFKNVQDYKFNTP